MIGDLHVVEIISSCLNTVLLGEVAGLFYFKYKKTREPLSLLLLVCFLGFCGSSIFWFARFYILFDPLFYRVEVATRFVAFTTFVFMYEHQVKNRRIPFLTFFCLACIILLFVLPYDLAYNAGFTIYVAALIVFWFFARVYRETDGSVKRNLKRSIIGALILGVGIGLSADLVVESLGTFLIVTGLFTQLAGMALLAFSFYSIGTTDEFRWYTEVQSVFLIFKSLCIYTYSIEQGKTLKEADLHGGGLATVLMVTQTIVDSEEPPEHIEYQNTNFLMKVSDQEFNGNRVVAVLIARKNLTILREKLSTFLSGFTGTFEKELKNWKGDTTMFKETCDDLVTKFHRRA